MTKQYSSACFVIRPLTAEEISQRREALKQRLADEKPQNINVNVDAHAAGELSNGNWDELLRRVLFLDNFDTF